MHLGWHVNNQPFEQPCVAIGWPNLGELPKFPDRDAHTVALAAQAPDGQDGPVPVQAEVLQRFCAMS